jgi:integrase
VSLSKDADLLIEALQGAEALFNGTDALFDPVPLAVVAAARTIVSSACKDATKGFVRFMIEDAALGKSSAETYANYVWHALITTGGRPVESLKRDDIQMTTKIAIKSSIRQYALYTKRLELLADLSSLQVKKMLRDRRAPTQRILPPFTAEEVGRILAAVDADKGNPQWPWAWPVLRITIKLGLRAGADTPWIQRDAVVHAAHSGGALTIWSKRLKMRGLPSKIVKDELDYLVAWPGAWQFVADLVAPSAPVENRPKAAYGHISRKLKEYAVTSGLEASDIRSHRFRRTAALRLYKETKDIMLVSNYLGHSSIQTTQIYLQSNRLEEMDEKLQEIYEEDEDE